MIALWLLSPLVLLALATGIGLLVERAGGHRLPGALVVVVGFTGIICATQVTVRFGPTAPLTPFVVVALAVAGLVVGHRRRPDAWLVVLGAAIYLVYAAPALATGEPTILGYTNMADGAGHFAIIDRLMRDGYAVISQSPSSLDVRANGLFITSYPTGSHTVLGALRTLTGTELAWLLQPYLAMLAALVALGLHSVVAPFIRSRALAAGVAGLATCAGLVYVYANNQQAVKEMGALVCIVGLVGVVAPLLAAPASWRMAVPAAVVAGGGLGTLSVALAPWLGPLLLAAAVALLVRHGWKALPPFASFTVLLVLVALPSTLSRTARFVQTTNVSLTGVELGNLYVPLPFVEALGVWPSGDFRELIPADRHLAWLLVGAVALGALLGLIQAIRRGAWPVLLFAAVSLLGFAAVAGRSSPWAYAKALMLLSPVALLLAGFAVAHWWDSRRRAEAFALGVTLLLGVGWTTALSYHVVDPMPHERFAELEEINERFEGQGPALATEAEEFAKYFLRDLGVMNGNEGVAQGLARVREGVEVKVGYAADTDDFAAATLAEYELLVVRRGPAVSRPPAGWERVFTGDYYDVWRRGEDAPAVLADLPLGGRLDAAARPPCDEVRALAELASQRGGRLAYAPRPVPAVFTPGTEQTTVGWPPLTSDPVALSPIVGPGTSVGSFEVREGGTQHVWIEASVVRDLTVFVDDIPVGTISRALNPHEGATRIGTVELDAGDHDIRVVHGGGGLEPGNGGRNRIIGPVTFTTAPDPAGGEVREVDPADWRTICGEHADWVAALS